MHRLGRLYAGHAVRVMLIVRFAVHSQALEPPQPLHLSGPDGGRRPLACLCCKMAEVKQADGSDETAPGPRTASAQGCAPRPGRSADEARARGAAAPCGAACPGGRSGQDAAYCPSARGRASRPGGFTDEGRAFGAAAPCRGASGAGGGAGCPAQDAAGRSSASQTGPPTGSACRASGPAAAGPAGHPAEGCGERGDPVRAGRGLERPERGRSG